MNVRTKIIGTVALGAALLVPVAQAQSPDDRAGLRGPGGIAVLQPASNHPDNRAEARGVGAVAQQQAGAVRPDDRSGSRGPGAIEPTTVVTASSSTGFDWRDALIGGIGGMGTALLLTGCLFLLTSQRHKARIA